MYKLVALIIICVLAGASCQAPAPLPEAEPEYRAASETWESWRDSVWVVSSQVVHTYTDGQVTERLQQRRVEDGWQNLLRDVTVYNNEDQRIHWTRSRWQDDTWNTQVRRDFFYEGDQLVERRDTSWVASATFPGYLRYTFSYNQAGDVVEERGEAWRDETWVPHGRTVSRYDDAGHHVEQQFQTWDGSDWQTPRRLLREYNDAGLHAATQRQSWRDGAWHNAIRYTFVLAEDGRRLEEQWTRPSENGWQNLTKVTYHFEEVP